MTMYGRSSRWAAAVAFGLAGLIGVGAAAVPAAPVAGTSAREFELTVEARIAADYFTLEEGTFRSRTPFCATGRFVDMGRFPYPDGLRWRFTCDDGTGSLTTVLPEADTTWRIVDGSGRYAGLRGKGSLRDQLCDVDCQLGKGPWRGTLQGVVDWDAVAPSAAITSARATKLRRPAGAHSIKLALALRDDVEGNPVSYTVRVCSYTVDACAGRVELARRFGTARTDPVSMKLRIRPPAKARTVQLQLTGEDPVGNAVSVSRALKLPR